MNELFRGLDHVTYSDVDSVHLDFLNELQHDHPHPDNATLEKIWHMQFVISWVNVKQQKFAEAKEIVNDTLVNSMARETESLSRIAACHLILFHVAAGMDVGMIAKKVPSLAQPLAWFCKSTLDPKLSGVLALDDLIRAETFLQHVGVLDAVQDRTLDQPGNLESPPCLSIHGRLIPDLILFPTKFDNCERISWWAAPVWSRIIGDLCRLVEDSLAPPIHDFS